MYACPLMHLFVLKDPFLNTLCIDPGPFLQELLGNSCGTEGMAAFMLVLIG